MTIWLPLTAVATKIKNPTGSQVKFTRLVATRFRGDRVNQTRRVTIHTVLKVLGSEISKVVSVRSQMKIKVIQVLFESSDRFGDIVQECGKGVPRSSHTAKVAGLKCYSICLRN